MKRLLLSTMAILTLASACLASFAQPSEDLNMLWERANIAYMKGNYATAAADYDSIYAAGYSSHKLYYNMGNAYFKDGKIGKSILFYNRALLLDPSDPDTRYNLTVVNTFVKDNITDGVPDFFLTRWVRALRTSLSSNSWAALSLILITFLAVAMLLYLLADRLTLRKTGFYTAICVLILFIMTISFSIIERHEILHSCDAIIMSSAVPVKSSPDNASKDIFILHEGAKVRIVSTLGAWHEIETDGNKGWIPKTAIETIR